MYTYDVKETDEVMQFDNTMMENTFNALYHVHIDLKEKINFPNQLL